MSALGTVTGNTQLAPTKADAISSLVQRLLVPMVDLLPTITDLSAFAVKGMKSISFPKAGGFVAGLRASGVVGQAQTAAFTVDKLDLDKPAYIQFVVDDNDAYQSTVSVKEAYILRSSIAHAQFIDTNILTILDASSGYAQAAGIDQTKILNARKFLLKNKARLSDLTLLVTPDEEATMLAIPDFVRADSIGNSAIPSGVIGRIYGVNVKIHNDDTILKSFMYSKEAIGFALQKGAKYGEQADLDYGNDSLKVVIDQLFGVKALRLGEGKDFAGAALAPTASPFIAEIG